MRSLILLTALALCGFAGPVLAQTSEPRPQVAVVVVTLDNVRHGQVKHGRHVLGALVDERFGRYRLIDPTIPLDHFSECEEDTPEYGLARCARFYLHRSLTSESPPHVVVAFADQRRGFPSEYGRTYMRGLCFGRGAGPVDPEAQDIWLWPGSLRIHGVQDWERDMDALAGCIEAALSEPPGEPKPDPL